MFFVVNLVPTILVTVGRYEGKAWELDFPKFQGWYEKQNLSASSLGIEMMIIIIYLFFKARNGCWLVPFPSWIWLLAFWC